MRFGSLCSISRMTEAHCSHLPATEGAIPVDQDIRDNKDIAALAYLWLLSAVLFFWKRNSPFVRFHAKQGMILFVLTLVLPIIPLIGKLLVLIPFAGMVTGFVNAAQGLRKDLPIVGPLASGEITVRQAWQQVLAFTVRVFRSVRSNVYDTNGKMDEGKKSTPPDVINL